MKSPHGVRGGWGRVLVKYGPVSAAVGASQGGSCSPTALQWVPRPWYPRCNICSAALQHHPVPKRVCPVIKGWLHRACSRSMAFLNSLSLRRRPHNERVSAGHELETDFVLLGKVMFTDHSLGVPDGWGGRSPQHYPEWPWKSWHISKWLLLLPPLCSILTRHIPVKNAILSLIKMIMTLAVTLTWASCS